MKNNFLHSIVNRIMMISKRSEAVVKIAPIVLNPLYNFRKVFLCYKLACVDVVIINFLSN